MSESCTPQSFGVSIRYRLRLFRSEIAAWLSCVRSAVCANQEAETGGREEINQQAEHLLNAYGNSILRLAYSYLHNLSDAEDIVQDTLIQYIKTKPSFASASNEKAWLMRVAANLSKNKIKYNRIRTADELNEQLAADETEDLTFVWEAVRQLPVKYREAIHLFYYEGYSSAQIAEILAKNEQTVRSILHRGRGILKDILKEAYDFEQ